MNIQFLYFEGCPNHQKAYDLLINILGERKITAKVERIRIADDEEAARQRFVGSPTIRVDGVDIESVLEDRPYAKTCRVYVVDGVMSGTPSKRMIHEALWQAMLERADI